MNIIRQTTVPAQPTGTTYRVEERTIDAHGHTTSVTGVLTAKDRTGGLDKFRQQLANNPGRYASGTGRRLVLVEGGAR